MKLLTTSNPKTQKGAKYGYLTAIQHFAPSKLSGTNVCSDASPECIRFCLNKAGRGGIVKKGETTNVIQEARKRRTKFYLESTKDYVRQLNKELRAFVRKCMKHGLKPAVRLNGTSDIAWEKGIPNLLKGFHDIQFYDYTKSAERMMAFLSGEWGIPNYHLTFSRSELNDAECQTVIEHEGNVAVVFDSVPATFRGYPVFSGDDHDLRFLDPKGVYIGLKAKGKLARYDSPFKVT